MILCALYLRVSSEGQREKNTIASQRTILPKVAASHGLEVYKQYVDDGISGESIEARPGFRALLDDASAGCFEAVVCIDFDRLTRATDLTQLALIKRIFREAKIKVITPNQVFDFENEDHDFLSDLFGILAKHEKRKILARTRRGIKEKMRQGKWIAGSVPAPYYKNGDGLVCLDPAKEKLFRLIIEDSKNIGRDAIAEKYGISSSTIRHISGRKRLLFYAGYLEVDGELFAGSWPPICTFEDIAEIRSGAETRRTNRGRKSVYLLTGLGIFICGQCGKAVGSHTESKIRPEKGTSDPRRYYRVYYRCGNRKKECKSRSKIISAERIERIVLDRLNYYFKNMNLLVELSIEAASQRSNNREVEVIDRRISDEEARKKNLISAISKGAIVFDDAREEMDSIKRTILGLQESRARLTKDSAAVLPADNLKRLEGIDINQLDFQDKRSIIQLCIGRILLSESNLSIEYRFVIDSKGENKERISLK